MIKKGLPYKKELLKTCFFLREFLKPNELDENLIFRIEKNIFYSFYIIRKLLEAKDLLSKDLHETVISLRTSPAKSKLITRGSLKSIPELYDLNKSYFEDHNLEYVCNAIIHSYFFEVKIAENNMIEGVLFSSDKTKNKKIYNSTLKEIIELLCTICMDRPDVVIHSSKVSMKEWDLKLEKEKVFKFPHDSIPDFGTPEFFEWMKYNLIEDYEEGDEIKILKLPGVK